MSKELPECLKLELSFESISGRFNKEHYRGAIFFEKRYLDSFLKFLSNCEQFETIDFSRKSVRFKNGGMLYFSWAVPYNTVSRRFGGIPLCTVILQDSWHFGGELSYYEHDILYIEKYLRSRTRPYKDLPTRYVICG